MKCYVVTAIVDGKRQNITKPLSLKKARQSAKNLRGDMKMAIPKYKWADRIEVGRDIDVRKC